MCLLLLFTAQTLRWPPFCIGHIVIICSLLWPSGIGLICSFIGHILGIYWLSQNHVGGFCWPSFILLCLLGNFVPKRFVLCCQGIFDGPIYHCLANRLCLIVLFIRRISPLLSLSQLFCSHYLFQKASLYLKH